ANSCLMVPSGMVISFSRRVGAWRSGACGVEGPLALPSCRAVPFLSLRRYDPDQVQRVPAFNVQRCLSPLTRLPLEALQYPERGRAASSGRSRRRVGLDVRPQLAQNRTALPTIRGKPMSTSSLHASRAQVSPATLVLAFIAGALAVPVFHQILLLVLYIAKIVPFAPFSWAPTKPLGVPDIISISFWGGVGG